MGQVVVRVTDATRKVNAWVLSALVVKKFWQATFSCVNVVLNSTQALTLVLAKITLCSPKPTVLLSSKLKAPTAVNTSASKPFSNRLGDWPRWGAGQKTPSPVMGFFCICTVVCASHSPFPDSCSSHC